MEIWEALLKNHVETITLAAMPSLLSSPLGCLTRAVCLPSTFPLQEPTAHQRAAYRDKRKEVGDPETELACWLLEALAKESEGDYVKSLMHQRFTMETLARYVCRKCVERCSWRCCHGVEGAVYVDALGGATRV